MDDISDTDIHQSSTQNRRKSQFVISCPFSNTNKTHRRHRSRYPRYSVVPVRSDFRLIDQQRSRLEHHDYDLAVSGRVRVCKCRPKKCGGQRNREVVEVVLRSVGMLAVQIGRVQSSVSCFLPHSPLSSRRYLAGDFGRSWP